MKWILCSQLQLRKSKTGEIIYSPEWNTKGLEYLPQTSEIQKSFPATVWEIVLSGNQSSLVSSLLGVTLVLKRFSYIGDGLSHTAFGAMAMASVLKISHSIIFVLPVTVFLLS